MDAKTYKELKEKVKAYEEAKDAIDDLEELKLNLFNGYPTSDCRNIYTSTSRTCNHVAIPLFIQKDLATNIREFLDSRIKAYQDFINAIE